MVIWITGLTASGKTTLGIQLEKNLKLFGIEKILRLDGDELRSLLENILVLAHIFPLRHHMN